MLVGCEGVFLVREVAETNGRRASPGHALRRGEGGSAAAREGVRTGAFNVCRAHTPAAGCSRGDFLFAAAHPTALAAGAAGFLRGLFLI